MGWFVRSHPLAAVDIVEGCSWCLWLVLTIPCPARIHFRTVTMCSVGQTVARGSHTSLEVNYTQVLGLGRDIVVIHVMVYALNLHAMMIQELLPLQSTSRLLLCGWERLPVAAPLRAVSGEQPWETMFFSCRVETSASPRSPRRTAKLNPLQMSELCQKILEQFLSASWCTRTLRKIRKVYVETGYTKTCPRSGRPHRVHTDAKISNVEASIE